MNEEIDKRIVGAAPVGARDRESAALAVREMFTSIAPRYDLLNHVLSFNIDRWWWWRAARSFDHILKRLRSDKKTRQNVVHFILPREIGKVEIVSDVPETFVKSAVVEIRRLARN